MLTLALSPYLFDFRSFFLFQIRFLVCVSYFFSFFYLLFDSTKEFNYFVVVSLCALFISNRMK